MAPSVKNYDLDRTMSDRDYVGTGYKGYAMQFHFQSAPDYIWSLAEKYLGLAAGALDNVNAVAVSFESTAMGRVVDLGVKLIDANEVRGIKAQPLNVWGHEAFRKSYIIGDSTLTTDYFTGLNFTADTRVYPVHPNEANKSDKVTVPVFGEDGTIIGYKVIAEAPKPNGGNIASGLKQVADPTFSPADGTSFSGASQSVTITTKTTGADIYYTTNGTTPTTASTKYSTPVSVSATTTIKAIAVKNGMAPSNVVSATYTKTGA